MLDLGRRSVADSMSERRPAPPALLEASYERLVDFAYAESAIVLIAESGLGPVGFLVLMDRLPDEVTGLPQAFVAYMAVEPHARRRGYASALLRAAEQAARERGLPHLALMATEENEAARELYAQAGFWTERRLLCKTL